MPRCLLFVLLTFLVAEVPVSSAGGADTVPLYGRWEREFVAQGETPTPGDVTLRAIFTGPGGEPPRLVEGFWDGDTRFKIRFMPTSHGTWRFKTESNPRLTGLDGVSGTFRCQRGEPRNPFLKRGPIRVSKNGRFFEHADGTPFFWLVDTAWNGALKSNVKDWERYLDDRRNKRFTGVQFVTTQWRTAYTDSDGQVAYTGFDRIRINPRFYQRLDARVDAVNEKGLLAVPVLLWTLGDRSYSPGQLPESEAIRLARYQVARYGAHHVAWFLPGDGRYFGENAERWKRIGRKVFDGPGHAPVFLHPQGMQWPFDAFLDENWVSAFGYQSGHGDDARTLRWIFDGPPARKWSLKRPRPVINLEPPYEAHVAYQSRKPHSAYNVRRAIYWSLLNAPTAGTSYGAHGVWSWESEPKEPLNHKGTGVAKPWHEAMQLEGSNQLRHLAELFSSLEWWTFEPDPKLVSVAFDNNDPYRHASASRSPSTKQAVVYLPKGGELTLNTRRLEKGFTAEWFDPRTGKRRAAKTSPGARYSAPDARDWVLVIR